MSFNKTEADVETHHLSSNVFLIILSKHENVLSETNVVLMHKTDTNDMFICQQQNKSFCYWLRD